MFPTRFLTNLNPLKNINTIKYVHYRVHSRRIDITEYLHEATSKDIKDIAEWKRLRENVLSISKRFTQVNVDSALLNTYLSHDNYTVALKYVQFLKSEQKELSLSVLSKLFKIYHRLYANGILPEEKEQEIIALVEEIKSKHPYLDTFTNEGCIIGLSLTRDWKRAMQHLSDIKVISRPSHACFNSIIAAAFKNAEDEVGYAVLEDMLSNGRTPSDECFMGFISKLNDLPPKERLEKINKLLNFFHVNDYLCSKEIILKIQDLFLKNKMIAKMAKISPRGLCNSCKKTVPAINITDDEFNALKKAFMERVIIGKDVFSKTTPEELRRFKEFVDRDKKYDVIIDGLNVAYSTGVDKLPVVFSRLIACVVGHYAAQKKSVLVLGRKHMAKWPPKYMNFVRNNSDLFLTHNISQDDPYLLYCALNSGMGTVIVTRDLMRSHLFLLKEPEHKKAFSRWLNQSQHKLVKVLGNDKVIIQHPLPYVRTAQQLDSIWHVPFTSGNELNDDNWMCIQTNV